MVASHAPPPVLNPRATRRLEAGVLHPLRGEDEGRVLPNLPS